MRAAKQSLVTGDAVRDQLLREALGVDPSSINISSDATLLEGQQSDLPQDQDTGATGTFFVFVYLLCK